MNDRRIGYKLCLKDRRKTLFDRREHGGATRILFIPVSRLLLEFATVTLF